MENETMTASSPFTAAAGQPSTLVELLRRRAISQPQFVGYTFLSGEEAGTIRLTYEELDARARVVAAWLRGREVRGARALLLYPAGLDFIIGFFGCLYAGVVAVPVYPPDPIRPARTLPRLRAIAADSQATVALTTSSLLAASGSLFAHAPDLRALNWLASDRVEAASAERWEEPATSADELTFLQYTSGSTGSPKGVMLTHRNLLYNAGLVRHTFEHGPADQYVSWLPMSHDMGFMAGVLQPLYAGIPAVLMSPASFLQQPLTWLRAISDHRATTSGGPNFAYDLCVRKITDEQKADLDLSSWRAAFNGSEPVQAETLKRFAAAFATCGFRSGAFYPCYGLAEATLIVSVRRRQDPLLVREVCASDLENHSVPERESNDQPAKAIVSCGRTLPGQKTLIVDPARLTACVQNQVGEVWVSGPSVAQGYWQRPGETRETFKARLADGGEGVFLRTGDLGFLQGGELYLTGRLKDLIIIRGRNHYPQDIEQTVELSHSGLRRGCGAAFSTEVGGEERLIVVHEISQPERPQADSIIDSIRQAISEQHELRVFQIVLIEPGTISKTSSGKIQRNACRKDYRTEKLNVVRQWRSALADEAEPPSAGAMSPDLSGVKDWLALELAQRLGLGPSAINLDRPLTSYGLDSLTAVELSQHLEASLGVKLPIAAFLQPCSVAQLAGEVVAHLKSPAGGARRAAMPVAACDREDEAALSQGQRGLWFLYKLEPDSAAYHIARVARIRSSLGAAALQRALQVLIARHACLRTTFAETPQGPAQEIHPSAEADFRWRDASDWDDSLLNARLAEEAQRPFSIERGPLLRVRLYTRSAHEHVMLLVIHHIVADFWSLAILMHELGIAYEAELSGRPAELPPLAFTYKEFVSLEKAMLASERGEQHWAYWREELSGAPPALELPADRPRPRAQTYRGASQRWTLSGEQTRGLKALGRAQSTTLYMTLLAAFQVLLYRRTSQEDLLVGSPTSGREDSRLGGVVGYFVNPIVVRTGFSAAPGFKEVLQQVRRKVLSAFDHDEYPFALLVERLQPMRDPSRSPIFQVMFVMEKAPLLDGQDLTLFALGESGSEVNLGGFRAESMAFEQRASQFDLTLLVGEAESRLIATFEYSSDLFDRQTVARLAGHFQILIDAVLADPSRPVIDLNLLTQAESHQLLGEFNDTAISYPHEACVHRLVQAQAERTPDAIAVVFDDERLTYRVLNERAHWLAHCLRERGVRQETLVAICLERSIEMVVGLLSVLRAGGAYVPLDPAYPRERLFFMLEDSHAPFLLTHSEMVGRLAEHRAEVIRIDEDREAAFPPSDFDDSTPANHLAYVIYTSGSTGKPKGAMNTHRGVCNRLLWMQSICPLSPADAVLQKTPLSFDVSVWELFWPLITGARLVVARPGGHKDSEYLIDLISRQQITVLHFVPSMLQAFIEQPGVQHCDSLRHALCSGEALTLALQQKFYDRLNAQLHNLYGPTETSIEVTHWVCEKDSKLGTVPIGRLIANTQSYLLDARLNPTPIAMAGELHIGGVALARGYLGRAALTAERFIPDPFGEKPGARLYKTGDLARYLPGGAIDFVGRFDQQIKLRGFRIELGEIEATLAQHAIVKDVAVAAHGSGAGQTYLVAYVVADGSAAVRPSDLRDFLSERLLDHMIPAFYVHLPALPVTPNGKLDRRALPAVEYASTKRGELSGKALTPTEEMLAAIWCEVLALASVGLHDNFFELGGHSLLATQVISRVRQLLHAELSLRSLFEFPTLAELARAIESIRQTEQSFGLPAVLPVTRDIRPPLSFAQQRMWFLEQFEPGTYAYNMPGTVRLKGRLNVPALERGLNAIVRRHEALRTTFAEAEGQPFQVIAAELQVALPVTDLIRVPRDRRQDEIARLIAEVARHPFDLATGPLLRAALLRIEDDEHLVVLVMHHIISDEWSLGIFGQELGAFYQAFSTGERTDLPALQVQYGDFAHWQRLWLRGVVLEKQLGYWRQLAGDLPMLQLPTDRPRPPVQSSAGAKRSLALPVRTTESLKAICHRETVTVYMALVAAFNALLCRYTGQRDILIGTPVANRNRTEFEPLIGLFVNTLVLRTEVSADLSFRQLLDRVREAVLEAYFHQNLPFERLVGELQPERDTSRNPVFQVMFAMQDSRMRDLELAGLNVHSLEVDIAATRFIDLTLDVATSGQALIASFEYGTDLFDATTIERMLRHFAALIEGVLNAPDRPIADLCILAHAERHQSLVEWNRAGAHFTGAGVHHLFEAQVERAPESIAVQSRDRGLSYRELNSRANRVARHLQTLGVGLESRAAIALERSPEMLVAMLATLKAGGAYVPLDPAYPQARLAGMLEDARPVLLITMREIAGKLSPHQSRIVELDRDWPQIAAQAADNLPAPTATNLAYVMYTSGSTGKPKGVTVDHAALVKYTEGAGVEQGIVPDDRVLQFASMSFDTSAEEIYPCLSRGARLVLRSDKMLASHTAFLEQCRDWQVSVLDLPTAYWHELVDHLNSTGDELPASLRLVIIGGECAYWNRLRSWQRLVGGRVRLLNTYGPTETTIVATSCDLTEAMGGEAPVGEASIGRPVANARAYLLDGRLQPVSIGVVGQLYVGGAGLARGYINEPGSTAEKFIPDPFNACDGARLYQTGDLARWDACGRLDFLGRSDHQIKHRGFRIEPGEIEAALLKHPAVSEAVVIGPPHEEPAKRLAAYFVCKEGQSLATGDLREFLKQALPDFMIPQVFIRLAALPLTAHGKVDRKALPANSAWPDSQADFVAPRDEKESALADIWSEVLGLDRVGVNDNFFELGGDSILTMQVISKASRRGLRLTPKQMFQHQTVAALARAAMAAPVPPLGSAAVAPLAQMDARQLSGIAAGGALEDRYPLSPVQQGMLFHTLYEPDSGVYCSQLACRFRGDLNVEAFLGAWRAVLNRHSVLRSSIEWQEEAVPLQVVSREARLDLQKQDWRGLDQAGQNERLEEFLSRERRSGFDLTGAPLMRLALFSLGEDEHQFSWTCHHALMDGWSLATVVKEVFALYEAACQGHDLHLAKPGQFKEYVEWLKEQDLSRAERFWREELDGFAPVPLPFGTLTVGPRETGDGYSEQRLCLSATLTNDVQSAARRCRVTLNTLLQGAWALLLNRYIGEPDIVFGMTSSGRSANLPGIETMVGPLINTLPVRVQVDPARGVSSWLSDFQQRLADLLQFEYSPLSQVQAWSGAPHGTPLFETLFVFENYPLDGALLKQFSGITITEVRSTDPTNYAITVAAAPGLALALHVGYSTRLIDAATASRLLGHLQSLLEGISANPERRISDLALLTAAERHFVLEECNHTGSDAARDNCVHELFELQAGRAPDSIALVFQEEQVTYRRLDCRANQLAHYLLSVGVKRGSCVAVCLEASPELILALLGVLKAGAAYVPLDPDYPERRLEYMFEDAHPDAVLTQTRLVSRLPRSTAARICLDACRDVLSRYDRQRPARAATSDDLAYVIYTSGSTGAPRGVMVCHRSACNHLQWIAQAFPLSESDNALQKYSASFDASVSEIFYPLASGARLMMLPPGGQYDAAYILELLERERVTAIDVVPAMLKALLADWRVERRESLRQVFCGGDSLGGELVGRVYDQMGEVVLANVYGPTEATITATAYLCRRGVHYDSVPIGRPVANTQVYILCRNLQPVPTGVIGEICIGGEGVAWGYLNSPEAMTDRFIADPFSDTQGGRLYRTGDLGRRLDDGNIQFTGRRDHQVKVRGFRIEPAEIEARLDQHPAVKDVVVVASEDEPSGKRLIAYVVFRDASTRMGELRAFLKETLPDHMVPALFVVLDELPLTPNGKVDRKALPPPDDIRAGLSRAYVAPRDETEARLAVIWSKSLGVDRVGVYDNFFELGGDSIISIQVIARARRVGLTLTPRQLFEHPTLAELASIASQMHGSDVEPQPVTGRVPLTPVQRWYFAQTLPDAHYYNQAVLLDVKAGVSATTLQTAIEALVIHHDALRLRFISGESGWEQHAVAREENHIFAQVDLSGIQEGQRREAMQAAAARAQASLDLANGPLVRMTCFTSGESGAARLLIVIHHLAVDGVSWRILLEDLQAACEQAGLYQPIMLPPKTTSFKSWAERLVEYARTTSARQELAYWLTEFTGCDSRLPLDHAGSADTVDCASSVSVSLSPEETRVLLQEVPATYHTQINDALLAALAQAVADWTGQPYVLVDLEGHGREDIIEGVDLSRTVGWFTTVFPLLLRVERDTDPGSAVQNVKERLRAVPNRGIGFGSLRYLSDDDYIRKQLEELPRPEMSFNYLGQLDRALRASSFFALSREPAGPARSRRQARSHRMEIDACVVRGRLEVEWGYSRQAHARSTVERLAASFIGSLQALIRHCVRGHVAEYQISDFPLAQLGREGLARIAQAFAPIEDIYPLTPMQEGMLFHSESGPASGVYCSQLLCDLEGPLDKYAFTAAWQNVLGCHAALRTGFVWKMVHRPLQVVRRQASIRVEESTVPAAGQSEQTRLIESRLKASRAHGFKLDEPPLIRLDLFDRGNNLYTFALTSHHLILDGWSMPVVLSELFALYETIRAGGRPELKPERPYRDYLAWLMKQDDREAESFWRGELSGVAGPTTLGLDKRSSTESNPQEDYAEQHISLSATASAGLQAAARLNQITINTVVQGAWALLLSRYSREQTVVFGTVVSGRPAELAGVESMVGLFINTLPVRATVRGDEPLVAWLGRLQARQVRMRQFQYTPLSSLRKWSEAGRAVAQFESITVFENYPLAAMAAPRCRPDGLKISNVRSTDRTNYPLTVIAVPGEQLTLGVAYEPRRFDDTAIRRMLGHLETVIAAVISTPHRRVSEIDLLTTAERYQAVVEWNQTETDYFASHSVDRLFEAQTGRCPEAIAIDVKGEQVTYRELNRRSNQLARHLRSLGAEPGEYVGICAARSAGMIIGMLAVIKAGMAYVPLDPTYPKERLALMLEDARLRVLLTQEEFVDLLPASTNDIINLDAEHGAIGKQSGEDLAIGNDPDGIAYVIYTSGSTGRPKGITIPHKGITRLVLNTNYIHLGPSDKVAQVSNSSFDAATFEVFGALLRGARLVMVMTNELLSPHKFASRIKEEGITAMFLTTALFNFVSQQAPAAFGPVKHLLFGGEQVDPKWPGKVLRQGPPANLLHVYGPTENTTFSTWHRVVGVAEGAATIPIGRPISNTEAYVLDCAFHPVPVGVPGEMHVAGAGLAHGYLNRSELTAERFLPNPFGSAGGRLYKTGDLVRRLPEGGIEFIGRLDDQVKIRGFRIEPAEVESVLKQHAMVRDAAVIAHEVAPGDKRLAAYVAGKPEMPPSAEAVRDFMKQKLPDYMVPAMFVILDTLPLTMNGKVDRAALRTSNSASMSLQNCLVAPRNPVEEVVTGIFAEVLQVERIGIHEDFFDLGGHSLLTTRIMSRVMETFMIDLPLRTLFDSPTAAQLSQAIVAREEKPGRSERIARLLLKVEGMSDTAVTQMLRKKERSR
jgi:amino acid adenylation domain-containing protein/non-ribosomal peptide synthase protein (TIGR01720 family)